jgi:hypothetical protein
MFKQESGDGCEKYKRLFRRRIREKNPRKQSREKIRINNPGKESRKRSMKGLTNCARRTGDNG